jgi:hypothetical protein
MIEELLKQIKEDKVDNMSTTSFKFKTDVWNFFQGFQDKVAIEFGTHKGQTTRILSFLFKKVYTINNNDNTAAKELNQDRDNIIYLNFDLYSNQPLPIQDEISMFLIDAGHDYTHIISDINLAFSLNLNEDCYIVFDDYGLAQYEHHVHKAVNQAIDMGSLTVIKGIGHENGFNFGGEPPRVLQNYEGLITKINFQ